MHETRLLQLIELASSNKLHLCLSFAQLTSMEKRRNTLDRWQRLRFGRRSASNPPEDKTLPASGSSSDDTQPKRSSDKSERLKELTELLKGARLTVLSSPSPPPIPPPRRMRPPLSASNSVDKYIDAADSSDAGDASMLTTELRNAGIRGVSLPPGDTCPSLRSGASSPIGGHIFHLPPLRPNSSAANLESARTIKTPPLAEAEDNNLCPPFGGDAPPLTALPRAESRTIVGSYMQKTIPFRSASFSQVDYSSGKYIRSALNALKADITTEERSSYSVVESANLTLPRKKDGSRGSSPAKVVVDELLTFVTPIIDEPPREVQAAGVDAMLDRRNARILNELNLNLSNLVPPSADYQQQRRRVSHAGSGPSAHVIIEEDNEGSPTIDTREIDYVRMDGDVVKRHSDPIMLSPLPPLPPLRLVQASEQEIAHDEMVMHSPKALFHDEGYLQTATQCLIPVSVYECVEREWHEDDSNERWINACEVESAKIEEGLTTNPAEDDTVDNAPAIVDDQRIELKAFQLPSSVEEQNEKGQMASDAVSKKTELPVNVIEAPVYDSNTPTTIDVLPADIQYKASSTTDNTEQRNSEKTNSLTLELDEVPAISVTPGSSLSGSSFEEAAHPPPANPPDTVKTSSPPPLSDYVVEVRKRHSNGSRNSDKVSADHSRSGSASGSNSPKSSMDEKRRIDKSKRRKGIYIRDLSSISWDDGGPDESTDAALTTESEMDLQARDLAAAISSTMAQQQRHQHGDQSEGLWLKCHSPDRVPLFDSNTPDSEYGRPMWPKISGGASIRRQSLSLQSSEEKDDSPTNSSPASKPHHKLFVLRSDSISDNEMSDRTPPSRERASQSPAPGDQDLKR